jgi:hypothetical protein
MWWMPLGTLYTDVPVTHSDPDDAEKTPAFFSSKVNSATCGG